MKKETFKKFLTLSQIWRSRYISTFVWIDQLNRIHRLVTVASSVIGFIKLPANQTRFPAISVFFSAHVRSPRDYGLRWTSDATDPCSMPASSTLPPVTCRATISNGNDATTYGYRFFLDTIINECCKTPVSAG